MWQVSRDAAIPVALREHGRRHIEQSGRWVGKRQADTSGKGSMKRRSLMEKIHYQNLLVKKLIILTLCGHRTQYLTFIKPNAARKASSLINRRLHFRRWTLHWCRRKWELVLEAFMCILFSLFDTKRQPSVTIRLQSENSCSVFCKLPHTFRSACNVHVFSFLSVS